MKRRMSKIVALGKPGLHKHILDPASWESGIPSNFFVASPEGLCSKTRREEHKSTRGSGRKESAFCALGGTLHDHVDLSPTSLIGFEQWRLGGALLAGMLLRSPRRSPGQEPPLSRKLRSWKESNLIAGGVCPRFRGPRGCACFPQKLCKNHRKEDQGLRSGKKGKRACLPRALLCQESDARRAKAFEAVSLAVWCEPSAPSAVMCQRNHLTFAATSSTPLAFDDRCQQVTGKGRRPH